MSIFAPADRDATLARVLQLLETDPRIEAAVLAGSLGAQRADRWSDIDVATVVADAEDCDRVAAEWIARIYRELPVAHHYQTAFGTTVVPGFLLRNGLEVDGCPHPLKPPDVVLLGSTNPTGCGVGWRGSV